MWTSWIGHRHFTSLRLFSSIAKNKYQANFQPDEKKQKHVFKSLYPWKTKRELAECLLQNAIHKEDGIIAINKPYGVPLKHLDPVGADECLFSIEDCLADMREILQCGPIKPVKFTERFTSGVSLLTYSDAAAEKIKKCYKINQSRKLPTFSYWAITMGSPIPEQLALQEVGLTWLAVKDTDTRVPIITDNWSKKLVESGAVLPFDVTHKIIDASPLKPDHIKPCLVEVSVHSTKNHFLRIYLSQQVSPILGDHIYGNRVQTIRGVRLIISPVQGDKIAKFQKISPGILTLLQVQHSSVVPSCLHLRQFRLTSFGGKSKDLIFTAEPPPHFLFACQSLGIANLPVPPRLLTPTTDVNACK